MSVWDSLVGQDVVVSVLKRAVNNERHAMTHAWLFTGPPGSGRSVAAASFAAALQCDECGCGSCRSCRTVLAGTHPDVTRVRTEQLSIGVDEVRSLVKKSAMTPSVGRWQILIVEDADRVTERGADALLKAVEEPSPRTVWMLCAPTADDVVVTIRSRSRQVNLVTPSDDAVATLLMSEGIPADTAVFAARVTQGHIGRARALATDPSVGERRREILDIPAKLTDLGECLDAASWAVKTAQSEAQAATEKLDSNEREKLLHILGLTGSRPASRGSSGQLKELEEQQTLRAKRIVRDSLDSVLRELTSYYRDVLTIQLKVEIGGEAPLGDADQGAAQGDAQTKQRREEDRAPVGQPQRGSESPAGSPPRMSLRRNLIINSDIVSTLNHAAIASTPESTLRKIDAINDCRAAISSNVAPQLAFEAMMVSLGMAYS